MKITDIHSDRMMIRVEQGKGRKDRFTLLSKRLLEELRNYWRIKRPDLWLFPGRSKRPKLAFDGPIEVFSHGSIVFSDANREKLATLTEFEQQPAFTSLSANLFAFNCCLFAAELIKRNTRRLAKSQRTWFKTFKNVNWLNIEAAEPTEKILSRTKALLDSIK